MRELGYLSARDDFKAARRRANMEQLMSGVRRERTELLAFDDVREQLKGEVGSTTRLQDIPLDAIVGSVGRVDDFTRSFMPTKDEDITRWTGVKEHIERSGMIPIKVFQIGDAYFVHDGHHRVSVSRQMGFDTISAYVTKVDTRVPLSAEDDAEEIICKARYADFLEKTNLDVLRPDADLFMSICGHYDFLLTQIDSTRYVLNLDPTREDVSYETAVTQWYDRVYLPLVMLIRRSGIRRHFPGRTETDLYYLVTRHRAEIQQALEWRVEPTAAAADLARQKSRRPANIIDRLGERLRDVLTPDILEGGPAVGRWRRDRKGVQGAGNLFADILVAGRAVTEDLGLFRHAIRFAQRENARLLGLLILGSEDERGSPAARRVESGFRKYCRNLGVRGEYAVEIGRFARAVTDRATWADLLVVSPGRHTDPSSLLGGEFGKVIGRTPRPILVVPEMANSDMDRALLAYDGSPKAEEALYLAAYLGSRWKLNLTVVSAGGVRAEEALGQARRYLEDRNVKAKYVHAEIPADSLVLDTAGARDINLILMGGFGFTPALQKLIGSSVQAVLAQFPQPVLICR
jgi:nucleotide-binding universal stress UspA family protein